MQSGTMSVKRLLKFLVSVVVIVGNMAALAPPANAADSATLTEKELVGQAEYVAQSFGIIGMNMSDLPDTSVDPNVLWNLAQDATTRLVQPDSLTKSATPANSSSCNSTDRFIHAQATATANKLHDSDAKSLNAETVYMYLSHYVDVPTSYRKTTCAANDEEPYYANWITNDDRNVYDSFLRVSNYSDAPRAVSSAISGIDDALKAGDTVTGVYKSLADYDVAGSLYNALSTGSLANSTMQANVLNDIRVSLRDVAGDTNLENEDAHDVVDRLVDRLSAKTYYNQSTALNVACVALSFLASGGTLLGIGLGVLQLNLLFDSGIAQTSAVAAMTASLSGRTSGRLMRAWGA